MLAIANIDVKLSKHSVFNVSFGSEMLAREMPKAISNAWVLKLEQAYKKALLFLPDDPKFLGLKKLYIDKMKELNIKTN